MNKDKPWYKDTKQRIRLRVGEIVHADDVWLGTDGTPNSASPIFVGQPYPSETVPFYRKKDNTILQTRIDEYKKLMAKYQAKIDELEKDLIKE